MRSLKYIFLIFIISFITYIPVHATSYSLSVSSTSVYVGDTFKVTVKVNAAAWNVHVSSTGPVSECIINQADASSDAENTNKTFTASCKATGEGTIKISLTGDITLADSTNTDLSGTKKITVTKKPTPSPSPSPSSSPSTPTTPSTSSTTQPSTQTPTVETKPEDVIETPVAPSDTETKIENKTNTNTNTNTTTNNNSSNNQTTKKPSIKERIENSKQNRTNQETNEDNSLPTSEDEKMKKTMILLSVAGGLFIIYVASMIFVQKKSS